jgi:hypothetical protein
MDDPDGVVADHEKGYPQESDVMGHPAMIVGEIVPDDVSRDPENEGQENGEWSADGMGSEGMEDFAEAVRKHFERRRAQKVKHYENDKAGRNAK